MTFVAIFSSSEIDRRDELIHNILSSNDNVL